MLRRARIAEWFRLLGDTGEGRARFLGLENPESLAIDKKDIIGRTALGLHFADRDPVSGGEIDLVPILNGPTRRRQLGVDHLTGALFRRVGHGFRVCLRGLRNGRLACEVVRFSTAKGLSREKFGSALR